MNKLSLQLTFAFISIFISGILAQTVEPKMVFESQKHDFGKIKEKSGKVDVTFTFTNMGSEPIVINDVKSSCGCTTPSWSKKPVAPGTKGQIIAVYNPLNRPGTFHKTVTVTSNAKNSPVTLQITGEVEVGPKDIADEYRYELGPIRMKVRNINFSNINNDETKQKTVEVINTSKENVKVGFNTKRRMPAHLQIICSPETLAPNQKGIITFTYDASKKNDWGYVYDRVYVSFNDKSEARDRINISATIKEKYTQEIIDNPPVFTAIGEKTFDFGTLKQGETTQHIFKFKNTGKNDLIIRKIKTSCGCTAATVGNKTIKPGEESSIKAVFNSRGKRGNQHKSITVTTNIPDDAGQAKQSQIILLMKGLVEIPKKETPKVNNNGNNSQQKNNNNLKKK